MTDTQALIDLQKDCGIPHMPTLLTHTLRLAPSGKGDRAYDWSDKPHRLLYDACSEIERLTTALTDAEAKLAKAREGLEKIAGTRTVKFDGSEPFSNIEIARVCLAELGGG